MRKLLLASLAAMLLTQAMPAHAVGRPRALGPRRVRPEGSVPVPSPIPHQEARRLMEAAFKNKKPGTGKYEEGAFKVSIGGVTARRFVNISITSGPITQKYMGGELMETIVEQPEGGAVVYSTWGPDLVTKTYGAPKIGPGGAIVRTMTKQTENPAGKIIKERRQTQYGSFRDND